MTNTVVYDLGSDPYLEIISVRAASCTPLQCRRLDAAHAAAAATGFQPVGSQRAGQPAATLLLHPEGQIAFYPTPDAVYDMLVTVALQPKDGVAQVPSEPLKKYSTGIEAGALMHLLRIPGQPWSDPKMAEVRGHLELLRQQWQGPTCSGPTTKTRSALDRAPS